MKVIFEAKEERMIENYEQVIKVLHRVLSCNQELIRTLKSI